METRLCLVAYENDPALLDLISHNKHAVQRSRNSSFWQVFVCFLLFHNHILLHNAISSTLNNHNGTKLVEGTLNI